METRQNNEIKNYGALFSTRPRREGGGNSRREEKGREMVGEETRRD